MHTRPLRLVLKRWKALYIVGGGAVAFGLGWLLSFVPVESISNVLATLIFFAWAYGATRIFRGSEELVITPRPWWRMTARPTAGFLLGIACAALAGDAVVYMVGEPGWLWGTGIAFYAVLAALYLGSSIRLVSERRAASVPKLSE